MVTKPEAGYSLIEILFSMAIFSVISAAMASSMVSMRSQVKTASTKFDAVGVALEIRNALANVTLCRQTLLNKAVSLAAPQEVDSIQLPGGRRISVASILPGSNVFVRRLFFDQAVAAGVGPGGRSLVTTNLWLQTAESKTADAQDGFDVAFRPQLVSSVTLELDVHGNAGTVHDCSTGTPVAANGNNGTGGNGTAGTGNSTSTTTNPTTTTGTTASTNGGTAPPRGCQDGNFGEVAHGATRSPQPNCVQVCRDGGWIEAICLRPDPVNAG